MRFTLIIDMDNAAFGDCDELTYVFWVVADRRTDAGPPVD